MFRQQPQSPEIWDRLSCGLNILFAGFNLEYLNFSIYLRKTAYQAENFPFPPTNYNVMVLSRLLIVSACFCSETVSVPVRDLPLSQPSDQCPPSLPPGY